MSWSEDQKTRYRSEPRAAGAQSLSEHPAKSIMASRWEERRARASELTTSGIQTVARRSEATQATAIPAPAPMSAPAAMPAKRSEQRAPTIEQQRPGSTQPALGYVAPAWMRNPQQALLRVALVSCSILLALLYFGGFLT